MQRWYLRTTAEGYDEYEGHVISGAAYAMFPPGKRARMAREMRATMAYRAYRARSGRIGHQSITSRPFS